MKKFLIIIAILLSYLIAKELLDDRPFKFEKYATYDELNAVLKMKFLIGSDMREAIKILEDSGARCKDRSPEEIMKEEVEKYGLVYWCEYESGWITLHPLEFYTIRIMGDKNYKLMHTSGMKTAGIII